MVNTCYSHRCLLYDLMQSRYDDIMLRIYEGWRNIWPGLGANQAILPVRLYYGNHSCFERQSCNIFVVGMQRQCLERCIPIPRG